MADPASVTISQLRWRCRRGMRELDTLLTGWVERHWDSADAGTRATFLQLLDAEDDALWDWVTGRATPADPALVDLVGRIVARRA
ncbi:succinate dehydrogenase assembly factor 2 [Wenzhouxiangella sp. XN79A]|uniref:FAD assembly factor SdhE n=1 Tax=Wenzhouxiangella sp. XN79A TaxID=2724193 RepID=UPI00144ADFF4|nr:succinate dehydrogenase assembly factor 2 [Wenzhouxiangella sp. XN79A]NKI35468.1 succinate dehydrogenase assembly factor 2 [Wenzhouxiangella sp. XN79A]